MKKILLGALLLLSTTFIISCNNKKEKLVSDFEQTLFNSKIDLNLNVLKINDYQPIYAKDSLHYFDSIFKNKYKSKNITSNVDSFIKFTNDCINFRKTNPNFSFETSINDYYLFLKELNTIKKGYSLYSNDSNRILNERFEATYSITNPFLNNAKQTITRIYILSKDNNNIIGHQ